MRKEQDLRYETNKSLGVICLIEGHKTRYKQIKTPYFWMGRHVKMVSSSKINM